MAGAARWRDRAAACLEQAGPEPGAFVVPFLEPDVQEMRLELLDGRLAPWHQ